MIDEIAGVLLTHLSGVPAQCAPRNDLVTRRNLERSMFELRTKIANACVQKADQRGESPLDQQG
jgi:hypothetical protein